MSKILSERQYSFSECISKANYHMFEAFYWSKNPIYDKSVKENAKNAEAWFELAVVARSKGYVKVAIPVRGVPYMPMSYSYQG